jgi:nucleoside-diphosphate-sugar epimerase
MILLTGASGFLGQEIYHRLDKDNNVHTIGREMNAIQKVNLLHPFSLNLSFDCVIHAAGKAHLVPKSQVDIQSFWDVNVLGTRNLLSALERNPPKRFVFISSVAVYGSSSGILLNEQTPVLAKDPYGLSKIQAEKDVTEWCYRNGVICTIFRLPLVYGENPPGNLKAMWDGIRKRYYFNVDGGRVRKSIVHAKDVAQIILPASEVGGIYHLTDGIHPSFQELSFFMGKMVGRSLIPNIPLWLARIIALLGDFFGSKFPLNSEKLSKILTDLTFDDSLAREKFDWNPKSIMDW